jgi:hypothetical protein
LTRREVGDSCGGCGSVVVDVVAVATVKRMRSDWLKIKASIDDQDRILDRYLYSGIV